MATVRALLRGIADAARNPDEVLRHINGQLSDDVHPGQFMTLFFLVVDLPNHRMTWASAGHDPAIMFNPETDKFSLLEGHGIPLGIERDWNSRDAGSAILGNKDIVVLGTDGIWETRNEDGEFYGKARLKDLIRAKQNSRADEICEYIRQDLKRFRGSLAQSDDVTAVVFRRQA